MTIELIMPANPSAIAEGECVLGVKVYGLEYACRHINNEIRVDCVSGQKYISRRPAWQITKNAKAVREWFVNYIEGLGAEYHEAHKSLYMA